MKRYWTAFLAACAMLAATPADSTTISLTLSPPMAVVDGGEVIDVDVLVSGLGAGATGPSVGAYDLVVRYDAALLKPLAVLFGAFLGDELLFEVINGSDDSVPGEWRFAAVSLLDPLDLDARQPAAFSLATLQFEALAGGVAQWAFVGDWRIDDAFGEKFLVVSEPPAWALLGLALLALLAPGRSAAQLPLAPLRDTGIEYTVKTDIDTRPIGNRQFIGNAYLKALVTLKNTNNQARKLMLCLHGQSVHQSGERRSPRLMVKLSYDAAAKQFTCAADTQAPMRRARHGNMGCQQVSLAAGAQTVLTFISGSSPAAQVNSIDDPPGLAPLQAQARDSKVVQDGNVRAINGAGMVPGHRMSTARGTFGVKPLYDVLSHWQLQLLVLEDPAMEMACMKAADVVVDAAKKEAAYVPPCSKPVDFGKACNKCFGMNTAMAGAADLPAMARRAIVTRDVSETVPPPGKKVSRLLPADPGDGGGPPRQLVAAITYLPGAGVPAGLLQACDPDIPGCYGTTPTAGVPFTMPRAGLADAGTFSINFPNTIPSNFTADFLITIADAVTGEVVNEHWTRVRPRLPCDFNEDGVVDRNDVQLVFQAAGSTGGPEAPYDIDGDGLVTVNDARACTLRCTNAHCAP